ncbi:3-ketoacyl-CoA thiolase 2, peroxisomal-like [Spinacia oleracea]|uniref:3-ketoacyl-CoA thiolase 2, peroxisomal-like n=1 Tax=Spinacia oleracea TaxID=3562 RepID=A0ABM3R1H0_SPIOL|nr:3-ketoacyl-CoA thiolase 2, peroxisomal-like [Spinacia oleracea]XP_056689476.1 3-ketoacyl-CoA thiolase 2, peroxisomal-like [Spinacia oleracea]XP_056689477.1 3-ketoacyl-CoA thiolase 2, peroxisomal-like [Spinacia oleracea]
MAEARLLQSVLLIFLSVVVFAEDETQFIYNGFQGANLRLDGLANIQPNGLLVLTNTSNCQVEACFQEEWDNYCCQVTDGVGAVLLMKRSVAMQKGLPVLGVFRTFAAVGVDPAIMGIGPAVAIPAAVKAAGLELDDIDLLEINEVRVGHF